MIRRKIKLGFWVIGTLLFLSGIISSAELIRLNKSTAELLNASRGNVELSKQLLDAVNEQNTVLLESIIASDKQNYDSLIDVQYQIFSTTLSKIKQLYTSNSSTLYYLTSIESKAIKFNEVQQSVSSNENIVTISWLVETYNQAYNSLMTAINEFMIVNENSLIQTAGDVDDNSYRAAMIGIIALAGAILLLLLFYFMLSGFFLTPVLNMEHSLKRYVDKGVPFNVEVNTQDEIASLKKSINTLIDRVKSK